ncbi:MAG: hypothetical protein U5N58_12105 [Actinomycetota bacterium]|nr:hypothetical protein [Actinomycetota bacterium]
MKKQMEITFLGQNQVRVAHRIINHNLWDIRFAPWSLTVMNTGGRAIIPQEPFVGWEERLTPVRPVALWGYTDMSDSRWLWGKKYIQLKQDPQKKTKQKLGVLNTRGWMAYVLGKQVFVKECDYSPDNTYPDFGVNNEVYTDSDILEMETLGNYESVAGEDYAEHTEYWGLFKAEIGTEEESIDNNLIPVLNKI